MEEKNRSWCISSNSNDQRAITIECASDRTAPYAMTEQANDVFEICSYVDGLEKKIDSMTEELTNMQNQIKEKI